MVLGLGGAVADRDAVEPAGPPLPAPPFRLLTRTIAATVTATAPITMIRVSLARPALGSGRGCDARWPLLCRPGGGVSATTVAPPIRAASPRGPAGHLARRIGCLIGPLPAKHSLLPLVI